MKKISKKLICGVGVFIGLVLVVWAGFSILKNFEFDVEVEETYEGRNHFFEVPEDYKSHLLIFPETVLDEMKIEKYAYEYIALPLTSSYDIYLEYTLEDELFDEEIQRLEDISVSYEGNTQKIVKMEQGEYDVYITSYMKNCAYEYALVDTANRKIVCIYTQLHEPSGEKVPQEYLVDLNTMEKEVGERFSVYYFKMMGNEYVLPTISGTEVKSTWYSNE